MNTREPDLKYITSMTVLRVYLVLEVFRLRPFGLLWVLLLFLLGRIHTVAWQELDSAFIESQSVSQMSNTIVFGGERQVLWYQAYRSYGIPIVGNI